jgi:Protein of unknown function (DUF3108)
MTPTHATAEHSGPPRRTLLALALLMLLLHLGLFLGVTRTLDWSLHPPTATAPLQTRLISPPPPVARPAVPVPTKAPVRRVSPAVEPIETTPSPTETPSPAAAPTATEPPSAVASAAPAASAPLETPAPVQATPTMASWPTMALGALPPSSLMNYELTGMDKGFTYYASGELRWQHNPQAYALTLSVKAFLIGSRHWRSTGQIDGSGLAPIKFTDSWRGERASHFDREQKRIVFSTNAPVAPLQPGAQDQISLYMQLAGAMAGDPDRYPTGTRLQVQTATLRDAVPWLLILEGQETLNVADQTITTTKWVCQPRNQFEARVEMWLSPRHAWMPARIRITQVSGSYIDLRLRGMEPLPPLPIAPPLGEKTTSS